MSKRLCKTVNVRNFDCHQRKFDALEKKFSCNSFFTQCLRKLRYIVCIRKGQIDFDAILYFSSLERVFKSVFN